LLSHTPCGVMLPASADALRAFSNPSGPAKAGAAEARIIANRKLDRIVRVIA
jgi:hypothetical protein